MRFLSKPALISAGCALLIAVGCSKSEPMNEQVEGTVKLDGAPLANVVVEFVPNLKQDTQAPISTATTDASGHFQLMCANEKPGAIIGPHNVLIHGRRGGDSANNEMDAQPTKSNTGNPTIPTIYQSAAKTPIKVDVTASQHSYEINVASGKGGGQSASGRAPSSHEKERRE